MVIADHLLSNGLRACGVIVKYTNLSVFNHVVRQEEDVGCPPDCFLRLSMIMNGYVSFFLLTSYMAACKTMRPGADIG